ncbi:ATP-binding protein [Brachybacterium horti]
MSPFIVESKGKERRRARRRRHQEVIEAGFGEGRLASGVVAGAGDFPQERKAIGHGTVGSGELHLPALRATTARFQAAIPFLADAGSGVVGPRIGRDVTGGGWFHFDPWRFYTLGWITGTSIVQVGGVGAGKSMTAKVCARRGVAEGRHVALASDPKEEWTKVAETVPGSQILRLGSGTGKDRINPLEPGLRPSGLSDDQWRQEVSTRQQQLLVAIVSIMRNGQLMTDEEHNALDVALAELSRGGSTPTIKGLIYRLRNPLDEGKQDEEVKVAGRSLARNLQRAVTGDLAGMFDDESSVKFDVGAPMLVMSTRTLLNKPGNVRAVASACTSFWIDSVVRAEDSGYWYVINEEGWSEMRDARAVELMDERQRLAGEVGLAPWMIMHEITDLNQVGAEGSAQRNQALGLLSKAQIKIIGRQSEATIDATSEALKLTAREAQKALSLDQGEALWKIGRRSLIVKTLVTRPEWDVMNTSSNRGGE